MTEWSAGGMLDDGLDVLWLTAGLGYDGESIALTAATQPAVEDLRAGSFPGVPPLPRAAR